MPLAIPFCVALEELCQRRLRDALRTGGIGQIPCEVHRRSRAIRKARYAQRHIARRRAQVPGAVERQRSRRDLRGSRPSISRGNIHRVGPRIVGRLREVHRHHVRLAQRVVERGRRRHQRSRQQRLSSGSP